MNLLLYDRPESSDNYIDNISYMIDGWRRTSLAIGGYNLGSFQIFTSDETLLTDIYNTWLGNRVVEKTGGITTWEGLIWQMDLTQNGVTHRRTLNPEFWHNRVKVIYSDDAAERSIIDWDENTSASDYYGEMEYVITLGNATSAGATAMQQLHLTNYAYPRSRLIGSVAIDAPSAKQDGVSIVVVGFWSTLNWQYRETSETGNADTLISTLIGETDYVTAGRIESNSVSVRIDAQPSPQRIGDLIQKIIEQGDASGNVWQGGVYADKKFVYEQAPTTVDYIIDQGSLYTIAGEVPGLTGVAPGFLVRDVQSPSTWQPPESSGIWNDPSVAYCNQVEYIHPNIIKLHFPGENELVDTALSRLQQNEPGRRRRYRSGEPSRPNVATRP